MAFEIVFAPAAVTDFKEFEGGLQQTIKKAMARHLHHEPERVSKSRIKRLRGLRQPQFRLRIDQVRVYYDVNPEEARVEVLRILSKSQTEAYLQQEGIPDEETPTDPGEG